MNTSAPRKRVRWLRWLFLWLPLLFVAVSVLQVLTLRWLNPPSSAFMLERRIEAWRDGAQDFQLHYRWRSLEEISRWLPVSVIAAEDQKFLDHEGFDFEAIDKAMERNSEGKHVRGASTISQQVAKNMFLWGGRNYIRKGLEAWYTVLIEHLWSKRRIVEVYVNIAEFGDGIYGADAAASACSAPRRRVCRRRTVHGWRRCCRIRGIGRRRPQTPMCCDARGGSSARSASSAGRIICAKRRAETIAVRSSSPAARRPTAQR